MAVGSWQLTDLFIFFFFTLSFFTSSSFVSKNKKLELKDGLLLDLQEKKKTYENLRASMEITTGACKSKSLFFFYRVVTTLFFVKISLSLR